MFIGLEFAQAEQKGGIAEGSGQARVKPQFVAPIQFMPPDAHYQHQAGDSKGNGTPVENTQFFLEKIDARQGHNENLEIGQDGAQSRTNEKDTVVVANQIQSEKPAAQQYQAVLSKRQPSDFPAPEGPGQQEKPAKKGTIKGRCRGADMTELYPYPGKADHDGAQY